MGDLDDDGTGDVAVSFPGAPSIGSTSSYTHATVISSATSDVLHFVAEGTGGVASAFGIDVSSGGDRNNDGTPDCLVGDPFSIEVAQPSSYGLPASFAIFGQVRYAGPTTVFNSNLGDSCLTPSIAAPNNASLFDDDGHQAARNVDDFDDFLVTNE